MQRPPHAIRVETLLFVSFYGKVFAVDRDRGEVVWKWTASKGSGSTVTLLPDGDRLFVSCQGYTWALDPATGRELWYQPFEGEGTGIPMLATLRGQSGPNAASAMQASNQAAVAAAAAAAVIAANAATTAAAS
jgi:outer membrane protein assembly factor BamB